MKTLNDVYEEITSSEENKEKFVACKSEDEVVDFVNSFGADATFDEIRAFLQEKQDDSGEVSEEDLKQVAGGKKANWKEALLSVVTVGTYCALLATQSIQDGDCGTAIKGDHVLCEINGEGFDF